MERVFNIDHLAAQPGRDLAGAGGYRVVDL
jgi:hypothetical protein